MWSRTAVLQLISARYGIVLPVRTMGHYLRRWGFTPQKPTDVQRWLDQQARELRDNFPRLGGTRPASSPSECSN